MCSNTSTGEGGWRSLCSGVTLQTSFWCPLCTHSMIVKNRDGKGQGRLEGKKEGLCKRREDWVRVKERGRGRRGKAEAEKKEFETLSQKQSSVQDLAEVRYHFVVIFNLHASASLAPLPCEMDCLVTFFNF